MAGMAGSLGGAACEAGGAVDCLLGDWGVWSTCDVTRFRWFRNGESWGMVRDGALRHNK